MLASLALVPAAIAVLAPAGPDDGCPSPRQVVEALAAHLPGVALPLGHAPGPSALRLRVATDATGVTLLDLGDANGETVLHRAARADGSRAGVRGPGRNRGAHHRALLARGRLRRSPARSRPRSCAARHPTARREAASAGGTNRRDVLALGHGPAGGRAFRPRRAGVGGAGRHLQGRIGVRLSGAITQSETATLPFATAHFRRYPVRLGGYVPLRLGPGQLEPGIGLDLDEISIRLTNVTAGRTLGAGVPVHRRVLRQPGAGRRPRLVGLVDASRLRPSPDASGGGGALSIRRGRVERGGLEYAPHLPRSRDRMWPLVSMTNSGEAGH